MIRLLDVLDAKIISSENVAVSMLFPIIPHLSMIVELFANQRDFHACGDSGVFQFYVLQYGYNRMIGHADIYRHDLISVSERSGLPQKPNETAQRQNRLPARKQRGETGKF